MAEMSKLGSEKAAELVGTPNMLDTKQAEVVHSVIHIVPRAGGFVLQFASSKVTEVMLEKLGAQREKMTIGKKMAR